MVKHIRPMPNASSPISRKLCSIRVSVESVETTNTKLGNWPSRMPVTKKKPTAMRTALGQDIGFRVGDEKKTRFARFGPPEGGRVGNLLAPDDEGTLVVLTYEDKPALLASRADR